jgi:phosphotransferase system enzyme I (PtsI)
MKLSGLGVSPGIGIGRALVVTRGIRTLRFRIPERRIEAELERLAAARERSRGQIDQIKARIAAALGAEHAYLFDAQLLMLDDPMLVDRAAAIIREERLNAESALQRALDEVSALFDRMDDPYLRERKGDVADVVGRLCTNLASGGDPADLFRDVEGPLVLVADELSPSIIAQLDFQRLAGLVTDAGSWTYHTAILARSIHVPAVAGVRNASGVVPPGAVVAVDDRRATSCRTAPEARRARGAIRSAARMSGRSTTTRRCPPSRRTARRSGSKERRRRKARARQRGAEGTGLYDRSAGRHRRAGRRRRAGTHRRPLEAMAGGRVTVRTDVSGATGAVAVRRGVARAARTRGLRLSLSFDEVFQAHARCGPHGPLRVMFPFVTGVEELRAARTAVAQAADALRTRGIGVPDVPIGIMIEVPSAALTIDLLAAEADFVSIGTNDLIQYTLAVDRTDDRVSRMYEPLHPAILRVLRQVAKGAGRRGVPVSVWARWPPIPCWCRS